MKRADRACSACAEIAGDTTAPGGTIFDDGLWFVSHHTGPFTDPGELIVKTRRHCESLGELSGAEAGALGPILKAAVGALERVILAERIYAVSFNERVRHVHFLGPVPASPESAAEVRATAESESGSPGRRGGADTPAMAPTLTGISRLEAASDAVVEAIKKASTPLKGRADVEIVSFALFVNIRVDEFVGTGSLFEIKRSNLHRSRTAKAAVVVIECNIVDCNWGWQRLRQID